MPTGVIPQAESIQLSGQSGFFSMSQGSMPGDLLESARLRVRTACLAIAGLWLYVLIMNQIVYPLLGKPVLTNGATWAPEQSIIIFVGFGFSCLAAWWINRLRSNPGLAVDHGLIFMVITALLVGLVTEWVPRSDTNAISWICLLILLYPAIAPASIGKVFTAAMAAASMDVVAIGIAKLRGVPFHPTFYEWMWLLTPSYVSAFLAVIPAKVIRGLGRQVKKARELGSYTLQERLGVGGMGEVYRGTHRLLARPAALKLITPSVLNSGKGGNPDRVVIERFRREAEAAANLRSPHTIELYDFGVADDGTFYYVMELLEGLDLEKLVSRFGPVSPARAIHFLQQACESLGEAHVRGLIHRDLKPSNLFACRMGLEVDYVKVLDFGLVKNEANMTQSDARLTAVGSISGTPAYMAPEMIEGHSVGPGADVYALGCVAYWLLTGKFVFQAGNATAMLVKHMQQKPEPPSKIASQPIPAKLDALIMECLAKEPAERPANAVELGRRLGGCAETSEWTEDMAQEWWAQHMNRTSDDKPREASEQLSASSSDIRELQTTGQRG